MDVLDRLKLMTDEPNEAILIDCLESAKNSIMVRRFPFGEWPDEIEPRYIDLQYRIALAIYNKMGADFQTGHSENGITRSYGSEGIPLELLAEIVPCASPIK